ncbi:viral A-type inclusion protein [Planoprotostelium fungivorum]|uniref:Viral A-type inclusion protein n=1 Tax=Planoprotostelium fungivorum TaxID=1890364 RepID=A0A2P6P077_9EUKA|nr:viral A-type inclusion protein [Planoprotostelium fungivorum]
MDKTQVQTSPNSSQENGEKLGAFQNSSRNQLEEEDSKSVQSQLKPVHYTHLISHSAVFDNIFAQLQEHQSRGKGKIDRANRPKPIPWQSKHVKDEKEKSDEQSTPGQSNGSEESGDKKKSSLRALRAQKMKGGLASFKSVNTSQESIKDALQAEHKNNGTKEDVHGPSNPKNRSVKFVDLDHTLEYDREAPSNTTMHKEEVSLLKKENADLKRKLEEATRELNTSQQNHLLQLSKYATTDNEEREKQDKRMRTLEKESDTLRTENSDLRASLDGEMSKRNNMLNTLSRLENEFEVLRNKRNQNNSGNTVLYIQVFMLLVLCLVILSQWSANSTGLPTRYASQGTFKRA